MLRSRVLRVFFRGGPHPTDWMEFRTAGPLPTGRFDHHVVQRNRSGSPPGVMYATRRRWTPCPALSPRRSKPPAWSTRRPGTRGWCGGRQHVRSASWTSAPPGWPGRAGTRHSALANAPSLDRGHVRSTLHRAGRRRSMGSPGRRASSDQAATWSSSSRRPTPCRTGRTCSGCSPTRASAPRSNEWPARSATWWLDARFDGRLPAPGLTLPVRRNAIAPSEPATRRMVHGVPRGCRLLLVAGISVATDVDHVNQPSIPAVGHTESNERTISP